MRKFEDFLPMLVSEYERGCLVPFVGAGISSPNCALWPEFIANLRSNCGLADTLSERASSGELIRSAEQAIRCIRNNPELDLVQQIRSALRSKTDHSSPPPATTALARIRWSLAITTNYDDWLLSEINRRPAGKISDLHDLMQVCGRGRSDTERVISSLRSPDRPLLWAIQGFIGGQSKSLPSGDIDNYRELEGQLVVGHEEYRREAYRSPGFRRAFAEVFRHRSLLFIGSGLSESYFESLFDETLELQGAIGHCHYAFVEEGKLDAETLRSRFQIEAIEYPKNDHRVVCDWIKGLEEAIAHNPARFAGWSFRLGGEKIIRKNETPDLQILRRLLPTAPNEGECIVVSAGVSQRGDTFYPNLSPAGIAAVEECSGTIFLSHHCTLLRKDPHIWEVKGAPVLLVAARDASFTGRNSRDARWVKDAVPAMIEASIGQGYARIYSMLLSAGEGRVFPSYISLMQMARGYAAWKKQGAGECELVICVVDPTPLALLSSGRLNLQEILSVPTTRFWLEIQRPDNQPLVRYLLNEPPLRQLKDVLIPFNLNRDGWVAWVTPSPTNEKKSIASQDIIDTDGNDPWTVENAGLIPGSTLRVVISKKQDHRSSLEAGTSCDLAKVGIAASPRDDSEIQLPSPSLTLPNLPSKFPADNSLRRDSPIP